MNKELSFSHSCKIQFLLHELKKKKIYIQAKITLIYKKLNICMTIIDVFDGA